MLPKNKIANPTVNLNPNSLLKLKDQRMRSIRNQIRAKSVVKDSKQTKQEFGVLGKQVSSQLGAESKNKTVNPTVNLNPNSLLKLKDQRMRSIRNQIRAKSVVKDSTQTKQVFEVFGRQVSSQLGQKEVKHVQNEGQPAVSSKKKSVIKGKNSFPRIVFSRLK